MQEFSNQTGLIFSDLCGYCVPVSNVIQWLNYETDQTGVFLDFLWHKNFVCMNCETYLALECFLKSPWPTAFEKLKILKNCKFSGLGWWIFDFSKLVGQAGFGAHSEAKLVSQFMQTKFLCHKKSQNTPILSVSYLSHCK